MEKNQIDYVVPMVFHDDKLWQADFIKAKGRYDETNPFEFVRYRSWGLEHILIKCVKKFMPFIRTIYVILARESQKQAWMDEEGVRVVYHNDFIPERFLPTFNSRAIEMFLLGIPDLSERFIYGNDDMFPVAPLKEEDFFEGDLPCLHLYEKDFPMVQNNFHLACRNGINFIGKEFGKTYTDKWMKGGHCLTPMLKSTWRYLWERGGDEIMNSVSAFREIKNFNQWLCPWWHFLAGKYVDRVPNLSYVSTKNSIGEVVKSIRENNGIVCINDNEVVKDYMQYANAVRKELEAKLNK